MIASNNKGYSPKSEFSIKINYDIVEKECMKVLLLNPNKSESYNSIFNKISEKDNIKNIIGNNPILLEELKIITYDVVNHLSIRQNNVIVSNNNGILKACYSISESNDMNNNVHDSELHDNDLHNNVHESKLDESEKDSINIISVIEFILNNKLDNYYYRKDHLGNTMLHYLVIHNRLDYITKYFNILVNMIDITNNNDKTPIHLIKSLEINSFFLNFQIQRYKENINILNEKINVLNDKNFNERNVIKKIMIMLIILYIVTLYNIIII